MSLYKRKRAYFDLVKRRGMTSSQALTIALAMHPIDKISRAASRSTAFKNKMLERADRFDRESRGLPDQAAEKMALRVLDDYCRIANSHSEQYYILRFCTESINPGASDTSG